MNKYLDIRELNTMFETALRLDNVEPYIEQVRGHRMFELVFNYNFGHGNSIMYRGRIQDGVRKSNMRRTEMNIKPPTTHPSLHTLVS